jgi:hypothetical protein
LEEPIMQTKPLTKRQLQSIRYRWYYLVFALIAILSFITTRSSDPWRWLTVFNVVTWTWFSVRAWLLKHRQDRELGIGIVDTGRP